MAALLDDDCRFLGYDVFGLIPPPSDNDPPEVHERYRVITRGGSHGLGGGDPYYGYVDDLYSRVIENFATFGLHVDQQRLQLHRGLFENTLAPVGPVALAHIDCDWHDPVAVCLSRIWPHLSRGGYIVLDDYNDYGGCRTAVDVFMNHTPEACLLTTTPHAVISKC
jgi:asparagine synthase (glutamine-hydrolysing)